MSTLIITEPDDIHAVLVSLALEKKGYGSNLLFTADMPSRQENTISFSNGHCHWQTIHADKSTIKWQASDALSVWWRRPRKPYVPKNVHPEDYAFVERENAIYHQSIPYLINPKSWWVNPIESTQQTRSKIVQLKVAQQCGMTIPTTLISNAPEAIRRFISDQQPSGVIYKSFSPHFWAEQNGMRTLYLNEISPEKLPSDDRLGLTPGIYQHLVKKQFELRVTCFGTYLSAVKIDSPRHGQGKIDWRAIPEHELKLEPYDLPSALQEKIILYMQTLGIVFGCFDFIVTPENDYIFLALNEQGQFLWVEDLLPELAYLDIFAEFLISRQFNFSWKAGSNTVSTQMFDAQAQEIVKHHTNQHVYLNHIKKVTYS